MPERKPADRAVFAAIVGVPLAFFLIVGGIAIARKLEVRRARAAEAKAGAPAPGTPPPPPPASPGS